MLTLVMSLAPRQTNGASVTGYRVTVVGPVTGRPSTKIRTSQLWPVTAPETATCVQVPPASGVGAATVPRVALPGSPVRYPKVRCRSAVRPSWHCATSGTTVSCACVMQPKTLSPVGAGVSSGRIHASQVKPVVDAGPNTW